MKRVHEDISSPSNGDVPVEASAGVAAEIRTGKAGNSASSPGAAGGAGAGGAAGHTRKKCPYLDTINRNVLDFDFEKVRNCPLVPWCCLFFCLCWYECVFRRVIHLLQYLLVCIGSLLAVAAKVLRQEQSRQQMSSSL